MNSEPARNSVLVVDDDADLRGLIEALAAIYGVPVLHAANCKEALKVLERDHEKIKLIFLDYFVPGMDPVKCAAAILLKADGVIPVVLLTAAADPAARAAELKISRWVAKPFDVSKLTGMLIQAVPT